MLWHIGFRNNHPNVMREYHYIVIANSRWELANKIKNCDGTMDISEAYIIEPLESVALNVCYAPVINGTKLTEGN